MSELVRTSFLTTYANSTSGTFPDNTTAAIDEGDLRQFATDISASHVMFEDLKPQTASGTDTYTLSASPTLSAYTAGRLFLVLFTNANTGAATLNVDSLGAKAITKNGTTALISGDIPAGSVKLLAYDGTRFQIIGNIPTSGTSSNVQTEKFTITSAQVLSSNSSPITLKSAPGSSNYYEIIRISAIMSNGTTLYDTNTNAGFYIGSVEYLDFQLDATADRVVSTTTSFSSADIVNQAITFSTSTGDPATGDYDVIVSISFVNVTV